MKQTWMVVAGCLMLLAGLAASEHALAQRATPERGECLASRWTRSGRPSRDAGQQYLYLADAGNGKVRMFDRRTLDEVGSIGRIGRYAGQFVFLHNVVDA